MGNLDFIDVPADKFEKELKKEFPELFNDLTAEEEMIQGRDKSTVCFPMVKHCQCGHLKDHHLREGEDLQCQKHVFNEKANKMLQCGCRI